MSEPQTDIQQILKIDCNILPIISYEDIVELNARILEPEKFENLEKNSEEQNFKAINKTIDKLSQSSRTSLGNTNDRFNTSNEGTLQNLLEYEFHYICQQNNDLIYLASSLMHRIVEGHPFEEGNKRTAYTATCLFLITYQTMHLNTSKVVIPVLDDALLEVMESVANNEDVNAKTIDRIIRPSFTQKIKENFL